jgi:hypothetical protein
MYRTYTEALAFCEETRIPVAIQATFPGFGS